MRLKEQLPTNIAWIGLLPPGDRCPWVQIAAEPIPNAPDVPEQRELLKR